MQLIKKLSFICKIIVRLGSIYVLLKAQLLFEELKQQSIFLPVSHMSLPKSFLWHSASLPRSCLASCPIWHLYLMFVATLTCVHPKHLRGCSATCVVCSELKSRHPSLARVQTFLVKLLPGSTHRQHGCFSHISRWENQNWNILSFQQAPG